MRKSHLKILPSLEHSTTSGRGKAKISIGATLAAWYRVHHRRGLPWRAAPGACQDPYPVWLSEVMLQQTTVPTVIAYFNKFLDRWPTLPDLAAATQEDVLQAWAGLGYYARGRNLHACARMVRDHFGGIFPRDEKDLVDLPGIGPYTAAAVGAIAFGARTMPVDGNIERVITRLYAMPGPVRTIKKEIKARAQDILDAAIDVFAGDLAQGFMDLGATICTPRVPKCAMCPLHGFCAAARMKTPDRFPTPPLKKQKPVRYGAVYLIQNAQGEYALLRRPKTGLLAGMVGLPTTEWGENPDKVRLLPGMRAARAVGEVRHSFTHFDLILRVLHARAGQGKQMLDAIWVPPDRMGQAGLPRVFTKALMWISAEISPPLEGGD